MMRMMRLFVLSGGYLRYRCACALIEVIEKSLGRECL